MMDNFKASLLREKFTIQPARKSESPIIALSNRISLSMISSDGIDNETIIVRAQNMHSCARMAAAIIKEFYERGTLVNRMQPAPWQTLWADVIRGYEKGWNKEIWAAVYHKGRVLYQDGEHHPFLDIVEQCDANNMNDYTQSIKLAEDIFAQAGKKVSIEYDSNVALITQTTPEKVKCGVISRSAEGTTTFNYTVTPKTEGQIIYSYTTLSVAASFLEAIQLAFQVGMLGRKKEYKLFEKYSDEDRQFDRVKKRMGNLNRAILNYEAKFHVHYRPDRPNFNLMADQAADASIKFLRPLIEEKIEKGEIEDKDWIV